MNLDILAIAAHADDVEITCGGTMIKLADMGKKTGVLDLTAGEMGTLGGSNQRLLESQEAAKIMKLAARENLHLPDSGLEVNQENRMKIAAVIRKLRPETVILPSPKGQRHPDHTVASIIGYDGCYVAGLAKADLDGEPHRPRKIFYSHFHIESEHSFYVDISDQFDRKMKAVAAYRTQFNGSKQAQQIFKPGTDIFELMETYHRKYGFEVGCRYAETFWIAEPILIDDPTVMPVQSI